MGMENYSLSDIRAVTDGNDGFGGMGGGWFAWILLFALFGGGGFGFGGGNRAATTEEVAAGFNFSGVNNKLNEIVAGQANINQNLGNAICSSTYELASKIDKCCCDTGNLIQQVRYDMATQNCDLKTAIHAEGEATRNMIQQDKIESLQQQVNALNLQNALCGVVRWPTSVSYATNCNPFTSNYGCGYNCAY